jgi:peroxiredoxin
MVCLLNYNHPDVIVGAPGAFSPTCSDQVPGYIQDSESFKAKGVQGIYIVTVNDAFTTKAWKEKLGGKDNSLVHFIADDEGKVSLSIRELISSG